MAIYFFQALLYWSCVSQKDNIIKHACDKEFQALIIKPVWATSKFSGRLIRLSILFVIN